LNNKIAVKFIIYGVLNFLLSYYLFTKYFSDNMWIRFSFAPIYVFFTFLSFHLLKWMNKEDWISAINLFDFKAMKKYVSGEMKGVKKTNTDS